MENNKIYCAVFKKAEEGGYTVTFPDLPGCITEGDTLEESYKNAKEALGLYLDGLDPIPEPSKYQDISKTVGNNIVLLIDAGNSSDIVSFKKSNFPQYFETALKNKGFTKYQVAQILGVDKAYIGRIAKGDRSPSVEMAKRIATLLEIDWRAFYATI